MAIQKVWIEEGCTACGICEEVCPEVFKIEEVSTVKPGVNYSDYEACIKESAENCPVDVIKFE